MKGQQCQTCGIKKKKNHTAPRLQFTSFEFHWTPTEAHHGNRPIVPPVGIPSHPELAIRTFSISFQAPILHLPYYFWEVIISLHIALTFDFPPFHGRELEMKGTVDTAGDALPPPIPPLLSLSVSCSFPDFH